MTKITIPDSVTHIDGNVFQNCADLTILGSAGSYAQRYAFQHSITFEAAAVQQAWANYVTFDGSKARIKMKYDDQNDIGFTFIKGGGNGLVDFRSVFIVQNDSPLNSDLTVQRRIISYVGDMFSPHIVCAAANGDGDAPDRSYFTGGNHRSTNQETGGGATARNISFSMTADGQPVTEDAFCNEAVLKWTNLIQGYNTSKADGTGREILREDITVTARGAELEVEITHTALEDIIRTRYYGLQMMSMHFDTVHYPGGSNTAAYPVTAVSDSGDGLCRAYVVETDADRCEVGVYADGLGQFQYNGVGFSAFTTTARKTYFSLIYDRMLEQAQGETTTFRGYYRFSPTASASDHTL